jgi:transposase
MESMEKAFRTLKTDLDIFPMRVRKESTIRGIPFVFFISLIMRNDIVRPDEHILSGKDAAGT